MKQRRGRPRRCAEQRIALACHMPESVVRPIESLAKELEIPKSDLVGWSTLQTINSVRKQRGEDSIPIPEYLDKAVMSALYPDALPLDDIEEQDEQKEVLMTG